MRISDFAVPDTPAARAARELVNEHHSPSLRNHVLRSWLWAEAFAAVEGRTGVDHELLYTAALLHDIALAPAFDNHTLGYEEAGGYIGEAMTAGAGWPAQRRRRINEVIVRHNWPQVDPAFDLEGYLLETATGLDISGRRDAEIPLDFRLEVLAAHPRLSLATEFGTSVGEQSDRKPHSHARRLIDGGLIDKLASNPLEEQRGPAN
ncbi:HD domain-containing protein [Microbacterium bovistercoris]|uniref:HD domain-containing protein n=1 Tax=Microbacterium bovistercoris TaxID=2293570 RepID=A0A371NWB5_9MICO|nr:HD domain-containing protein [Microbacterium bovistercoris]REJ06995.1 HD domain-containing protein [Microbacterium bovistercoris]